MNDFKGSDCAKHTSHIDQDRPDRRAPEPITPPSARNSPRRRAPRRKAVQLALFELDDIQEKPT